MITYPITRFIIEAFRDDEPSIIVGLTLSQAISVVTFVAGLIAWASLWKSDSVRHVDRPLSGSIRVDSGNSAVGSPGFSTLMNPHERTQANV